MPKITLEISDQDARDISSISLERIFNNAKDLAGEVMDCSTSQYFEEKANIFHMDMDDYKPGLCRVFYSIQQALFVEATKK